jgi:lysozyme
MLDRAVLDLSHWNEDVDLRAVKHAGVVGVIHKVTEGDGYQDPTYKNRCIDAINARLKWGAYHFMRPGDMQEQAQFFVHTVGLSVATLYAADYEDENISISQLKEFLRTVRDLTGRPPVLYSGYVLKENISDPDPELADYPLWLAQYTTAERLSWPTGTWPEWWLWQYSNDGSCPGVEGYVDVNRYDGTTADLAAEWAGWRGLPRDKVLV